jgi:hypothetical protein
MRPVWSLSCRATEVIHWVLVPQVRAVCTLHTAQCKQHPSCMPSEYARRLGVTCAGSHAGCESQIETRISLPQTRWSKHPVSVQFTSRVRLLLGELALAGVMCSSMVAL